MDNKLRLSPYHKVFYYEWLLNPNSKEYNVVFDQTLDRNLNVECLENALLRFIEQHFIFNCHILEHGEESFWVLNNSIQVLDKFESDIEIYEYASKPFDLKTGPLYRFATFTDSDGSYRFISVMHHILIDGNSFNSFVSEISNYYNSSTYKTELSLQEQKSILENAVQLYETQLEQFASQYQHFWDEKLGNIEALDLRWAKSESNTNKIKEYRFTYSNDVIEKLSQITEKHDISTYLLSQCIFALLLYKYTSQNEIAISYPIKIKGGISLISGACVNTNICVYEFNSETTISELIRQSRNYINSAKSIGLNACYYPINKIIDNERKNLLEVMFAQTCLKDNAFTFNGVNTVKVNTELNIDLPVKIILELKKTENNLNFRVRYNSHDIDETILTNFAHQYERLFLNVINDLSPEILAKPINDYSILSEMEYQQIVYSWNEPKVCCRPEKTIQHLFEEQVLKTPDNIAAVYNNVSLTYTELNERANQLAHYIRSNYDVKGDDLIALYLDRSEYMLISILGVLKAGGAYVPIDITNPKKRIRYILDDTATKLLITNEHFQDYIRDVSINDEYKSDCKQHNKNVSIIAVDSCNLQYQLRQKSTNNLRQNINERNLAYVMYTSGTTGNPKGVMLEQRSVTSRVLLMIEKSGINVESKYLFKTNYVFDVSFSDIFMVLLSGATLYITKSIFDVAEICDLIEKNEINTCHFVPSQLEVINEYLRAEKIFSKLKVINVSGEKFNKSVINANSCIKYVNYYGPTETGEVSCDITDISNQISDHLKLGTIGYPLSHSKLYILDNQLKPLPIGAVGELYIGGSSLARAYLNLPELTQRSFIPNPFQTSTEKQANENERLYKTGDLARYLSDGNIEYIGRRDNQVKIRGFRVELDEIVSRLSNYPGVKQAVILVQQKNTKIDTNEQYLVAYYVSDTRLDETMILDYLMQDLPEYMVPSVIMHLENLPLTTNGKLDKRSLPRADITANLKNRYVAPRSELEQKICASFADILKIGEEQIGINDSFFKLGGNSISAIRLSFKLQQYFEVTVNDIFELKTPAKLANLLPANNIKLLDRLEQIKLAYLKLAQEKDTYQSRIELEHAKYQRQVNSLIFDIENSRFTSVVLLTGATGYLGCHLLYQLLTTTNHIIYLPIRTNNKCNAYTKLYNKFNYYFEEDLNVYNTRIKVFSSDISKTKLGLSDTQYEDLVANVDSIIHSAALVKHYGENSEFYLENVQSTINLLELAKLTTNKDFHYISTIGVFTDIRVSDSDFNIFKEENIDESYANLNNIYTKTKYQGEQVTLKYREYGIKANIYRIGNLAINSTTNKTQENLEDNAFFQRVKTILKLGMLSQELSEVEISPVDSTATAVILLFNQIGLYNQIYHVFNPVNYSLHRLLNEVTTNSVKEVPLSTFVDNIVVQLTGKDDTSQLELFMLHQWGLHSNLEKLAATIIFQDKTNLILDRLKFRWPKITDKMLCNLVKKT